MTSVSEGDRSNKAVFIHVRGFVVGIGSPQIVLIRQQCTTLLLLLGLNTPPIVAEVLLDLWRFQMQPSTSLCDFN